MDSEYFSESTINFGFGQDDSLKHKQISRLAPAVPSESLNGCFDCNICLDSAQDPVVTLCGHLYCWPCIYKWIQVQSSSLDSDEQPKCPVCKAYVSNSSLVPLYGRGTSSPESEARKRQFDQVVPRRPPAVGNNTLLGSATSMTSHPQPQIQPNQFHPQPEPFTQQQYFQPQLQSFHHFPHPFGYHASIGPAAMTSFYSPMIWMFGEMVSPGMFGSSSTSLFAYSYPNSYSPSANGSPRRMRRQQLQLEKSLGRVQFFLLCVVLLCLLTF